MATINSGEQLILIVGMALGLGACDLANAVDPIERSDSMRSGDPPSDIRRTKNTSRAISSPARDVAEFRDNGAPHINSHGFSTVLTSVSIPDPADPTQTITTAVGQAPTPGQPSVRIDSAQDDFAVEVVDPQGAMTRLSGISLLGLTLSMDVTTRSGEQYPSALKIVAHTQDTGGDLYEVERLDPNKNNKQLAPLCEKHEIGERYARFIAGVGVQQDTGTLVDFGPGMWHIGCYSAAPAKAIELGYGHLDTDLATFATATRVVRADYCGDGYPYTFFGNAIRVEDNVDDLATSVASVKASMTADETFEAVWDEYGVRCLGKPRAADVKTIDIVCPTKRLSATEIVHNWKPPRCNNEFVDANPNDDVRIYSVISPEPAQ
ncbi:MAG: ADYC domain-containing protein [Myxococcota bacterium]